jgi:AcrR family transcriptional regulator
MSAPESGVSPEPESAPARSREQTRRRLIEAGTELFAVGGLHAVTSAQIARHAGVATGTFYLHFQDKKALFREIVLEALRRLRSRQDAAGARSGGDAREEFRARTAELLRFAGENHDLVRVLFGRDHAAADLGEDVLDQVIPGIEQRLRERLASGEAPSGVHPGVAAQAVAAMTARVVAWWIEHPDRARSEEVVETLLRMHPAHLSRIS